MGSAASVQGDLGMSTKTSFFSAATPFVPRRQDHIYEPHHSYHFNTFDINTLFSLPDKDPVVHELLYNALNGFLALEESDEDDRDLDTKTDLLIRSMTVEKYNEGAELIHEGEPGSNLYVVEEGELEVTINGKYIRTMGRGSVLGELALLYDAPRSATIKCISNCVLWSLTREIFKTIQAVHASSAHLQRARYMVACKDLQYLSAVDMSRLVNLMKLKQFIEGEYVYQEGNLTSEVHLIERGRAAIYTSKNLSGLQREEVDTELGIVRPLMDPANKKIGILSPRLQENVSPRPPKSPRGAKEVPEGMFFACEVYEGCVLGFPALKGKAGLQGGWSWKVISGAQGDQYIAAASKSGAEPTFTCIATNKLETSRFTVRVFERLFGAASKALQSNDRALAAQPRVLRKFDFTKFEMKYIFGSGSFGTVCLGEYRESSSDPVEKFALKLLNKVSFTDKVQLRHLLDERKLLSMLDSPFIVKLYGTVQTTQRLVMVTEVLDGGDLWGVIYEQCYAERGLPLDLVQFYSTCLILGFAHIHDHGISFRDCKPENVMVDSKGYLRIIDFGFAKMVPFDRIEENGTVTHQHKTYTLCGTPGYLAPEFVFNMGHDHAVDLWALGVVIHEMTVAFNPFEPKRHGDMTQLFANIAQVKKSGLKLRPNIYDKNGGELAADLIKCLLQAEPSERIGIHEGNTRCILQHEYFSKVPIAEIEGLTYKPSYIPPIKAISEYTSISSLPAAKPFKGAQNIFAEF